MNVTVSSSKCRTLLLWISSFVLSFLSPPHYYSCQGFTFVPVSRPTASVTTSSALSIFGGAGKGNYHTEVPSNIVIMNEESDIISLHSRDDNEKRQLRNRQDLDFNLYNIDEETDYSSSKVMLPTAASLINTEADTLPNILNICALALIL
jgi:hypothetical protein